MLKYLFTFLVFSLFCGAGIANPIFVDADITYRITSDSTVNIVRLREKKGNDKTYKDSILIVPPIVEYGKRTYRVLDIEEASFSALCCFRTLIISDGIEAIHNRAFIGCANLKGVTIPKSVKIIGDNPFAYCI